MYLKECLKISPVANFFLASVQSHKLASNDLDDCTLLPPKAALSPPPLSLGTTVHGFGQILVPLVVLLLLCHPFHEGQSPLGLPVLGTSAFYCLHLPPFHPCHRTAFSSCFDLFNVTQRHRLSLFLSNLFDRPIRQRHLFFHFLFPGPFPGQCL